MGSLRRGWEEGALTGFANTEVTRLQFFFVVCRDQVMSICC